MRVIGPSSEAEMILVFLRGELDSERFGPGVRAAIDERLLFEADLEDEGQNALRRAALTKLRGYESREGLFHGLPDDIRWERAALTPDDVLAVRYIEYDYWVELAAARDCRSMRPTGSARGSPCSACPTRASSSSRTRSARARCRS